MAGFVNASSTETPESVAAALKVAGLFGFRQVAALSQFESFGNENWLVEIREDRRIVLRRYLHANRERIAFQIRLRRRLHALGFPVAEVLTTTTGGGFHVDEQDVAWAAFEHVEGREFNFSTEDAIKASRRLAEFHLLGAGWGDAAPPLLHRPSIRDCWANSEADVAGLRELFAGAAVDDELAYLEAWWRVVRQEWPLERLDALPHGLVHGDFHGRNLAYTDEGLVGIFDFDDVEHGPLVHDLAGSTYKFGRESRFSPPLRPDVVNAFLAAYSAVRPLTAEERAALPVMMAMSYPPNPRYYCYYRDHHGTNIVNRLRREVGVMRMLRADVVRVFPARLLA